MAPGGGPKATPPLPPGLIVFRKLVATCNKCQTSKQQHKFVKKLETIPTVALPTKEPCRSDLNLTKQGLIGKFIGIWPSPKYVDA